MKVLKIHIFIKYRGFICILYYIVANSLVPTTAGDFCFWRKVRRCWFQGYVLGAHRGFGGGFGLFDLAEDLKAKQKQERSVAGRHDMVRLLSSAVDYCASLNPQNQQKENKQFKFFTLL